MESGFVCAQRLSLLICLVIPSFSVAFTPDGLLIDSPTKAKVQLIGTIIDHNGSQAILSFGPTIAHEVYDLGSKIPGIGTLEIIDRNSIVIKKPKSSSYERIFLVGGRSIEERFSFSKVAGYESTKLVPLSRVVTKIDYPSSASISDLPEVIVDSQHISEHNLVSSLGFGSQARTKQFAEGKFGVEVGEVQPASIFAALKFNATTVVTSFDNKPVSSVEQLLAAFHQAMPGQYTIRYRKDRYSLAAEIVVK